MNIILIVDSCILAHSHAGDVTGGQLGLPAQLNYIEILSMVSSGFLGP